MSEAINKVGRPITNLKTARAEYAMLKAKAAAAKADFDAFEKYCLTNELMFKEIEKIIPITKPATERKKYKRTWADGSAV